MISLKIHHKTTYRFNKPVALGPHRLMLRPRENRDLRLISSHVTITPEPVVTWAYDVFGNAVATATFQTMTDNLVIDSVTELQLDATAWPVFSIAASPPTQDDVCRALEQSASGNGLPVDFFARVIWQESRFDAKAVSAKGAQGIAQFMPRTASWHGLADPLDPIEALRHSAAYLHELLNQFGNLGLAAAAYNAGPARVSAWLINHRALPAETHNYVALVTGWTADEWASSSPPENAETTIPQGVPCTRLANLILAPKPERQRTAAYIPRWGIQVAAHLSESTAWAIYRDRLKRFGPLIEDREPIVLHKEIPGMGRAKRYNITIADDDRGPLDKLCQKLIAADATCDVLRNSVR